MNNRERGSYARGVYPTQYTSCMGKARVKQEEDTDTRIVVVVVIQAVHGSIITRQKYKGTSNMNCRELGKCFKLINGLDQSKQRQQCNSSTSLNRQ